MFRCTKEHQFAKYAVLSYKLMVADELDILEITGCLSSCHKSSYEIELRQKHEENTGAEGNSLEFKVVHSERRHEVKEQVRHRKSPFIEGVPY